MQAEKTDQTAKMCRLVRDRLVREIVPLSTCHEKPVQTPITLTWHNKRKTKNNNERLNKTNIVCIIYMYEEIKVSQISPYKVKFTWLRTNSQQQLLLW